MGGGALVLLRGGEARFFIVNFAVFAPVGAGGRARGIHDREHGPVGFGDDPLGTDGGERAHGWRLAGGEHVGVVQGDGPHAAHRDAHAVVFLHFTRCAGEGVVGPEVGQRALQAPGAASILHDGGLAKRTLGVRSVAPELFVELNLAEGGQPTDFFFTRWT